MKAKCAVITIFLLLLAAAVSQAQYVTVSGVVSNFNTGSLLENASVFESVSTIGTLTDKQGHYKLMLKTGEAKILVSHVGYKELSTPVVIEKDTILNIRLTPVFPKSKAKIADVLQQVAKPDKDHPKPVSDQ